MQGTPFAVIRDRLTEHAGSSEDLVEDNGSLADQGKKPEDPKKETWIVCENIRKKEGRIQMMQFRDDEHKAVYNDLMQRMAAEDWDTNRAAFAYLVALDTVCRDHIRDLYDLEDGCIHYA